MRTPAGRLLIQTVCRSVQPPEMLPEMLPEGNRTDDVLAVIGTNADERLLTRSLAYFPG